MRLLVGILLSIAFAGAFAHENHDASPAAALGNAAQRLPDGSLFVPKSMQRQLAVRTVSAAPAGHPRTNELAGHVIADPNAGGRVQSTVAGRVESGPRGLPTLGARVERGQVLAYVQPATPVLERAGQQAEIAGFDAQIALAERRLRRLEQLEGSVPQKEVDAVRFELQGLRERRAAVGAGLSSREALVAPVSGVVAAANVVAGQVVDARDVLFELVDPTRLLIEALAYEPALAADVAGASLALAQDTSAPLAFVGAGGKLRDQALPLLFRLRSAKGAPPLAAGQAVRVVVQSRATVEGVALPNEALVRGASNEPIVWVHDHAELFVPRRVKHAALDGGRVVVIEGLQKGDRVVVRAAPLLAQIR